MTIPILNQIENKSLYLKGYRLSKGHCQSLCDALGANSSILSGIKLVDNHLNDESLSHVFKGLLEQ
jgi:hypothetical protein